LRAIFPIRTALLACAWAAIACTQPAVALQVGDQVRISEVHYDPESVTEEPEQFVELYNAGTSVAYLDGAVITDEGNFGFNEATFQFPGTPLTGTTIPLQPGAFLLLVVDATQSPYSNIVWEFFGGIGDTDVPEIANLVKTSGLASDLRLGNDGDGVTLSVGITTGNIIPCNEVVDGVSWESGGGASEATGMGAGVCSDPSPHSGQSNGNQSLQRIQNGNDTNASTADFGVAVRTPGVGRPCALDGTCLSMSYFPCTPLVAFTVELSLFALEANAGLTSVRIFHRVAGVATYDSLDATAVTSQLFRADLPGQVNQTRVQYYAVVHDGAGNTARVPSRAPSVPAEYRVGPTTIATVQGSVVEDSCGSSTYAGTAVNVRGVVSHRAREFADDVFYIQRGNGPSAGIRVRSADGAFVPDLGDSVSVSGMVEEQNCQTTIELFPWCGDVHTTHRKVKPRSVASPGQVAAEANEGMLVTLRGPCMIVTPWLGQGDAAEFAVTWAAEAAWVGGDTFQPDGIGFMVPPVGATLDSITGIVAARALTSSDPTTRLRIEPRRDYDVDLDISDAPDATPFDVVRLHPNPARPHRLQVTIEFAPPAGAPFALTVYDAAGRRVRQLATGSRQAAGRDRVVWDGTDDAGRAVGAGAYFVRLRAGDTSTIAKLLVLR